MTSSFDILKHVFFDTFSLIPSYHHHLIEETEKREREREREKRNSMELKERLIRMDKLAEKHIDYCCLVVVLVSLPFLWCYRRCLV
jgi:hypothetical protein